MMSIKFKKDLLLNPDSVSVKLYLGGWGEFWYKNVTVRLEEAL